MEEGKGYFFPSKVANSTTVLALLRINWFLAAVPQNFEGKRGTSCLRRREKEGRGEDRKGRKPFLLR